MTAKVVKTSTKGQITLPKEWRKHFDTDTFVVKMYDKKLIVEPLTITFEEEDEEGEEIIFDADRDNDGKGVPIEDVMAMLQEIKDE